jgi:hypothetical protein
LSSIEQTTKKGTFFASKKSIYSHVMPTSILEDIKQRMNQALHTYILECTYVCVCKFLKFSNMHEGSRKWDHFHIVIFVNSYVRSIQSEKRLVLFVSKCVCVCVCVCVCNSKFVPSSAMCYKRPSCLFCLKMSFRPNKNAFQSWIILIAILTKYLAKVFNFGEKIT